MISFIVDIFISSDLIGLRRVLEEILILMASKSYWASSALPPGYSASSRIQFHLMLTVLKVMNFVVGEKS